MPQHTSSEVTVGYNTITFKSERLEPNYDNSENTDNRQTYRKSAGKYIKG